MRASALKRSQARMKRDSGCKMYHGALVTDMAACWTLASCSKSRIDPDRRISSELSPDSRLRDIPFARRARGERLWVWARRIGGDGFPSSLFSAGSMDIGRVLGHACAHRVNKTCVTRKTRNGTRGDAVDARK